MQNRKLIFAVILNILAVTAFAYTVPASDTLGYPIYDILVNKILCEPMGFVGGLLCIGFGARQFIHYNYADSGPPFFGLSVGVPLSGFVWFFAAAAILNAEHMLVSEGAMI